MTHLIPPGFVWSLSPEADGLVWLGISGLDCDGQWVESKYAYRPGYPDVLEAGRALLCRWAWAQVRQWTQVPKSEEN